MASADVLDIRVTGKGGHASTPYLAHDPDAGRGRDHPGVAGVRDAADRHVRPGRRHDHVHPRRHDDQRDPRDVTMRGTLRAVSKSSRRRALEGIERVVTGIAAAHDMTATLTSSPGTRRRSTTTRFAGFALDVAADLLGAANTGRMPAPVMGAEDFSYVLRADARARSRSSACARPASAPRRRTRVTRTGCCSTKTRCAPGSRSTARSPSASHPACECPTGGDHRRKLVVTTARGRLAQLVRAQPSHG